MATPRKHWFRVADSVLYEPWTDHQLATVIRLQAYLNTRWARNGLDPESACEAELPLAACRVIARRTHRAHCERALRALEELVSIAIEARGECLWIRWPKFAEFQGFQPRELPESRPRASRELPSPIPPPPPPPQTQEREKKKIPTARPAASLPAWALACSRLLVELLGPVPGARIPRGAEARWAREIARMPAEIPELAGNGRPPEAQIEAAIRWALGPENLGREYEVVIRSGKSLREKWPQLVAAARRRRAQSAPQEAMDEWVRTGRVSQ